MSRLARGSAYARVVVGVVARPAYWSVAVRVVRRLAPLGWWRRPPFLPIPSASYARFRLQTQYGGDAALPSVADVLKYLRWVRQWDAAR